MLATDSIGCHDTLEAGVPGEQNSNQARITGGENAANEQGITRNALWSHRRACIQPDAARHS